MPGLRNSSRLRTLSGWNARAGPGLSGEVHDDRTDRAANALAAMEPAPGTFVRRRRCSVAISSSPDDSAVEWFSAEAGTYRPRLCRQAHVPFFGPRGYRCSIWVFLSDAVD